MKKLLAILLVISMLFCMCACGDNTGKEPEKDPGQEQHEQEPPVVAATHLYSVKTKTSLTVRSQPGTSSKALRKLEKAGIECKVYEEQFVKGYTWMRISETEQEWIADNGTYVDVVYDGTRPEVAKENMSERDVKTFANVVFSGKSYSFVRLFMFSKDDIANNALCLSDPWCMYFFCAGMRNYSLGGLGSNKNNKNYGMDFDDIDELVESKIIDQSTADEIAEKETYVGLYVKKSWLQSCMDYLYGKNVIKISKWQPDEYDVWTDSYILLPTGFGDEIDHLAICSDVNIEKIEGSTAVLSMRCVAIDGLFDDESCCDNGYVISDISTGKELYAHKSFERSLWDFFSGDETFSQVCEETGLSEDSFERIYINLYKDSNGVHIKNCEYPQ